MFYKVFYTNLFVLKNSAGTTRGPFIFIRPEYKDDIGLLEHEKIHVKQWWKNPLFHGIMYLFSEKYRLNCEVEAYKEQLKHCPANRRTLFAKYLVKDYNLKITLDKAKKILL